MAAYRPDNPSISLVNIPLAGATFDETGTADNEASIDVQYTVRNPGVSHEATNDASLGRTRQ
jgi:hypothetical protein